MNDALIVSALSLVPKNLVARWMGAFGRTRFPRGLQRLMLRAYVAKYGPNLDECVGGIDDFACLTDFFTRALKPGARPVDPRPDSLVSPADGVCSAVGTVVDGRIPQAPGIDYPASDLLGRADTAALTQYAVIYLSPKDYHRVHAPIAGRVTRFHYLPGRLWPVFPAATRRIRDLFSRNERLVTWMETAAGPVAVVMVGAFGVGRIKVVYDPIISNTGAPELERAVDCDLASGQELGRFELGSTVILLAPPSVRWEVAPGTPVRLGQRIAGVHAG